MVKRLTSLTIWCSSKLILVLSLPTPGPHWTVFEVCRASTDLFGIFIWERGRVASQPRERGLGQTCRGSAGILSRCSGLYRRPVLSWQVLQEPSGQGAACLERSLWWRTSGPRWKRSLWSALNSALRSDGAAAEGKLPRTQTSPSLIDGLIENQGEVGGSSYWAAMQECLLSIFPSRQNFCLAYKTTDFFTKPVVHVDKKTNQTVRTGTFTYSLVFYQVFRIVILHRFPNSVNSLTITQKATDLLMAIYPEYEFLHWAEDWTECLQGPFSCYDFINALLGLNLPFTVG